MRQWTIERWTGAAWILVCSAHTANEGWESLYELHAHYLGCYRLRAPDGRVLEMRVKIRGETI
jgi:hypothetical protein